MTKEEREHRKRLGILRKHLGDKYYKTGQYHNAISDSIKAYANSKQEVSNKEIEKAIRETLVIGNKKGIPFAVKRIEKLYER